MMTSLLITKVFPPATGGSGRWFWEIYSRLPRDEYAIVAGDCAGATAFDGQHDLNVRRISLAYPDLGYFGVGGYLRYQRTAKQISDSVRWGQISAIHCGALLPDGWLGRMLARKHRIPLLVYMHGEETCYTNSSRQLRWMGERILRDADRVIANSENTDQILREEWKLPAEKITVLHPGVDCERFVPAERNEKVRERLGWSGRRVILTVGRLQERKGQDMLIRALPQIAVHFPDVLYAIVGDGNDYVRLESLVAELGLEKHVRFHRELSDEEMLECYQQCDLFVLPNRRVGNDIEGFGMVLLEAQACGKPVLAGDSGGTAETMQIPETGGVVDCSAPELLANKIIDCLKDSDRLADRGQAGRAWATRRFDWRVLSEEAREIHRSILGRWERPRSRTATTA